VTVAFVSPSYDRAGEVRALNLFGDGLPWLVVPDRQVAAYEDAYPGQKVIGHPDELPGISAARQWIAEQFPTFFSVDDDVDHMADHGAGPGQPSRMAPETARAVVERAFAEAEALGIFLVAYSVALKPVYYQPQKPYALTGVAHGEAFGLREGHGLFFPPDIPWGEDTFVSALNAYHHRLLWKDLRHAFPSFGMNQRRGGLARVRTRESVEVGAKKLRETFGKAIVTSKNGYPALRVPW